MHFIQSYFSTERSLCSENCSDLVIEVAYPAKASSFLGDFYIREHHVNNVIEGIKKMPGLYWVKFLKKLVFIPRGTALSPVDDFVPHFIKWFVQGSASNCYERVWFEPVSHILIETLPWHVEDSLPVKRSLILWPGPDQEDFPPDDEDYGGLHHLEHLGDVDFSAMVNLQKLTYIRGYCVDEEVFSIKKYLF